MSACAKCENPLTLEIEADDSTDMELEAGSSKVAYTVTTVPDDVELSCGCHFHWECLIDSYEVTQCPSCTRDITSSSAPNSQQILCNLHNEGGLQENLDILPLLTEESYLRAYPEDRICRAFLELCREGDVQAIVELLKRCEEESGSEGEDEDEDEDEEMDERPKARKRSADEVLRYQDPIGDMQSGLHAAVASGQREVAWLLLLLASQLPELEFPALVYQEAGNLGIMRQDQEGKVDIRSLRDAQNRTAEQLAATCGPVWNGWAGKKRLAL